MIFRWRFYVTGLTLLILAGIGLHFFEGKERLNSVVKCGSEKKKNLEEEKGKSQGAPLGPSNPPHESSWIKCRINEKVLENVGVGAGLREEIPCLWVESEEEAYLPFSYLKKVHDLRGSLIPGEPPHFGLEYSYSRVFRDDPYEGPSGEFLYFGKFQVEYRSRVKFVSGGEGVPVSSQWDKEGYFYPTQIAQYGLSHWSKLIRASPENNRTLYESGLLGETADWDGDTTVVKTLKCVHFDRSSDISLKLNSYQSILSLDLLPSENVTISVHLQLGNHRVVIRYANLDSPSFKRKGNVLTIGYGTGSERKSFVRDLHNDLVKGGLASINVLKSERNRPFVRKITLSGVGCVANLTLSNEEHRKMFLKAAEWLVLNQDNKGSWPVGVKFNENRYKYSQAPEIPPGWYSGMAQGHALSLLTRAFLFTKNKKYLQSAVRALKLFEVPSSRGGFKAVFMDKYPWYEEYPTTPATFVLNGFMYSLFGLYDLASLQEEYKDKSTAKRLYEEGILSLVELMHLFDAGSSTVYDLRHFTMKVPPKIARWDYHSTHINLLYALSSIQENKNFSSKMAEVADRWVQYMLGRSSDHN